MRLEPDTPSIAYRHQKLPVCFVKNATLEYLLGNDRSWRYLLVPVADRQ